MLGGQHLPSTPSHFDRSVSFRRPCRVRANPYMLIEVRGIGFPTADRGLWPWGSTVLHRTTHGCYHLCTFRTPPIARGHTLLPNEKLIEQVRGLIGLAPGADASGQLVAEGRIKKEPLRIALADLARDETDVAVAAHASLRPGTETYKRHLRWISRAWRRDQQEAFNLCMANPVFILTGAPGTGKTYLLRALSNNSPNGTVSLPWRPPRAKQQKRMSEMIGMPASTIHRLLGPNPTNRMEKQTFLSIMGVAAHLPNDVVVIDEFSMVDVPLAARPLPAIAPGTGCLSWRTITSCPASAPGRCSGTSWRPGCHPMS